MSYNALATADPKTVNSFEDVSVEEDGRQFILSTTGDLILARKVTTATRAVQCLGQVSDETAQQISKDSSHISNMLSRASYPGGDEQIETRPKTSGKKAREVY